MSAFLVSREHIDAILNGCLDYTQRPVTWAGTTGTTRYDQRGNPADYCYLDHTSADVVGRMLWMECASSVAHRYSNNAVEPTEDDEIRNYTHRHWSNAPNPIQCLKLLNCLEYQSCEHPGWDKSEAKRFVDAARAQLITRLPGYEEAPWEWSTRSTAIA